MPIGNLLANAWGAVTDITATVAGWVNDNIIQPVGEFFGDIFTGIANTVGDVINWAGGLFNQYILQPITGFFDGMVKGIQKFMEDPEAAIAKMEKE